MSWRLGISMEFQPNKAYLHCKAKWNCTPSAAYSDMIYDFPHRFLGTELVLN